MLHIFIMPVLILFYAVWQYWRISDTIHTANLYGFAIDGILHVRQVLAISGLLLSSGALSIVTYAVLLCALSARCSRASVDQLITHFTLCKRRLPYLMVGEMMLCGLAVVSLLASEILWVMARHQIHAVEIKALAGSVIMIVMIIALLGNSISTLKKSLQIFKPADSVLRGENISEQQAPAFWQWIRQIAHNAQLTVPDNIVVGLCDSFFVTANTVQLKGGERLTGNTLHFPLTYASLMSKAEIAAIIGHELGHFSGEDTQYSLRFVPIYDSMQRSLAALADNSMAGSFLDNLILNPALDMGRWFLECFHESVNHWNRLRELAADRAGAKSASSEDFSSALLRVIALTEPVNEHLDALVNRRVLAENWVASLHDFIAPMGSLDVRAAIDREIAHPMDSHPITRERIAALGVAFDKSLIARASRPVSEEDYGAVAQLFDVSEPALYRTLPGAIVESQRQALQTDAGRGLERLDLWMIQKSSPILYWGGWLLIAMSLLLWVPAVVLRLWSWLPYGLAMLFLGVVFIWQAKRQKRRVRQPIFSLTAESIESIYIPQPLMLRDITAFDLQADSSSMTLVLYVREGYHPDISLTKKQSMPAIRFNDAIRAMQIYDVGDLWLKSGRESVKVTPEKLTEWVGQYLTSDRARQHLQDYS